MATSVIGMLSGHRIIPTTAGCIKEAAYPRGMQKAA